MRRLLLLPVLMLGLPAYGQTIADVRSELSRSLAEANFANAVGGLVSISEELELSGANYDINNGVPGEFSDTDLSALALPFRRTFKPWGEETTGLYVEGVAGMGTVKRSATDIYGGAFPSAATSVRAKWRTYGGLIGIGPEFLVTEGLTITPILNAGISYIKNDARYSGPGASLTSQLFDGIAFNWDGWTASGGGALRIDWIQELGHDITLETVGRYDLRWVESFATDDTAQEFTSRVQLVTLRVDLVGPTGWSPFGRKLYWRSITGYRHYFDGELYDMRNVGMFGAGLEWDVNGLLPFGDRLSVKGAFLIGEQMTGYTIGAGLSL